jgi:hypothetical protein
MSDDAIKSTVGHVAEITGTTPTLSDLLRAKDLWETVHEYWLMLYEETERQNIGYETIRVVDFDIIYPAFWKVPVPPSRTFLKPDFSFPMTANFVFKHTRRPFTIPPGAFFELTRYLLELENQFGVKQSALKERFKAIDLGEIARTHDNNSKIQLSISALRKIAPESIKEIDLLIEMGARLKRLRRILKHECYEPWDTVMDRVGVQITSGEVKRIWHRFNDKRPRYTISNYLDALNMASYYSLLQTQLSDKTPTIFPLLASGTSAVLNFDDYPDWLSGYQSMITLESIKPVSTQYLTFATIIETYTEGNVETLYTFIREGIDQVERLLSEWRKFWDDCRRHFFSGGRHDARTILLSQLTQVPSFYDFCLVYDRWKTNFTEIIGSTFIDVARADRQLSRSYELTHEHLIGELAGELKDSDTKTNGVFDWNQSTSAVDTHLLFQSGLYTAGQQGTLNALRSTSLLKQRLLREMARPIEEDLEGLKIKVLLPHISETLFSWERANESTSQLCVWQHALDIGAALREVRQFLWVLGRRENTYLESSVELFGEDRYESITLNTSQSYEDWLNLLLSVTSEPEYLRIESGVCTVFLDTVPFDEEATLEVGVMYEDDIHHEVAEFRQNTASSPFSPTIIEMLLREYAEGFDKPDWVQRILERSTEDVISNEQA